MPHNAEHYTAQIEEHITPRGTRIVRQTPLDGDSTGMSRHLSKILGQEVVASPNTWIFSGPGRKKAANFVIETARLAMEEEPERYAGYNVLAIPGERQGAHGVEPMMGIVIASTENLDPATVAETAAALATETNVILEEQQSDIRLPLTS